MLRFFKDYEKINKPVTKVPEPVSSEPSSENLTVDDVKSYFDTMKSSIIEEIKNELKTGISEVPTIPNESEVNNNASNTDL